MRRSRRSIPFFNCDFFDCSTQIVNLVSFRCNSTYVYVKPVTESDRPHIITYLSFTQEQLLPQGLPRPRNRASRAARIYKAPCCGKEARGEQNTYYAVRQFIISHGPFLNGWFFPKRKLMYGQDWAFEPAFIFFSMMKFKKQKMTDVWITLWMCSFRLMIFGVLKSVSKKRRMTDVRLVSLEKLKNVKWEAITLLVWHFSLMKFKKWKMTDVWYYGAPPSMSHPLSIRPPERRGGRQNRGLRTSWPSSVLCLTTTTFWGTIFDREILSRVFRPTGAI